MLHLISSLIRSSKAIFVVDRLTVSNGGLMFLSQSHIETKNFLCYTLKASNSQIRQLIVACIAPKKIPTLLCKTLCLWISAECPITLEIFLYNHIWQFSKLQNWLQYFQLSASLIVIRPHYCIIGKYFPRRIFP